MLLTEVIDVCDAALNKQNLQPVNTKVLIYNMTMKMLTKTLTYIKGSRKKQQDTASVLILA